MTTAQNVRDFRRQRGWTIERLAIALGVDKSTVWRWENEKMAIRPSMALALSHLADLHPPQQEPAE